jgi:hypothetical protein
MMLRIQNEFLKAYLSSIGNYTLVPRGCVEESVVEGRSATKVLATDMIVKSMIIAMQEKEIRYCMNGIINGCLHG